MKHLRNTLVLTVTLLLASFLFVAGVSAQDSTSVPDESPVAEATATAEPEVDTTTTTTTTTTAPATDIGLTLNWAIAFVMLWQAAGIAYAVSVEKTIKPMLYSIAGQFSINEMARNGLLIIAVFIGAFAAVNAGGINLFADAPFGLFADASPSFLLVLNSLFVAAGAFMGAEVWATLESWLKKAKAVSEILTPPSAQTYTAQTFTGDMYTVSGMSDVLPDTPGASGNFGNPLAPTPPAAPNG